MANLAVTPAIFATASVQLTSVAALNIALACLVDISLEAGLPLVFADFQLIEACIMHLDANAKEAMPNGGTIQIQTGVRSLNRMRLDARPPIGPGEYVTVSVVDTGAGIPLHALPFYTTKNRPPPMAWGRRWFMGPCARPLAPNQAPRPRPEPVNEESLQGDETVLLAMESDADRQRLRDAMESAGYNVLDSRSALQALEIARKSTESIQLRRFPA